MATLVAIPAPILKRPAGSLRLPPKKRVCLAKKRVRFEMDLPPKKRACAEEPVADLSHLFVMGLPPELFKKVVDHALKTKHVWRKARLLCKAYASDLRWRAFIWHSCCETRTREIVRQAKHFVDNAKSFEGGITAPMYLDLNDAAWRMYYNNSMPSHLFYPMVFATMKEEFSVLLSPLDTLVKRRVFRRTVLCAFAFLKTYLLTMNKPKLDQTPELAA